MSIQEQGQTLYERLGGVYSIACVVDDLVDRVMSDPRLNANSAVNEAHHKVPPAGFKYLVTEMVCWASGGPQKYTGRSMADSHRHLTSRRRNGALSWTTSSKPWISSTFRPPSRASYARSSKAHTMTLSFVSGRPELLTPSQFKTSELFKTTIQSADVMLSPSASSG
jgi:truncated hemoglobin YjbI